MHKVIVHQTPGFEPGFVNLRWDIALADAVHVFDAGRTELLAVSPDKAAREVQGLRDVGYDVEVRS